MKTAMKSSEKKRVKELIASLKDDLKFWTESVGYWFSVRHCGNNRSFFKNALRKVRLRRKELIRAYERLTGL